MLASFTMLNPINFVRTPEYLFNPKQALQRFRRIWHREKAQELVRLPWGASLQVHPTENIGRSLYYYGIFDKVVPEAIVRLLDRDETAIEVGANIGQNCSLMARILGPNGRVTAFEPHPEIAAELRRNASRWDPQRFASVQIEEVAIGSVAGEALLEIGSDFQTNRGTARIGATPNSAHRSVKVRMDRLDAYFPEDASIAVVKIDVEGHELEVLKGAASLLRRRAFRDIIFEDFAPQPSPLISHLKNHGYEVFHLCESWLRPLLVPPGKTPPPGTRESHNYLATTAAARAAERYARGGWRCLMLR
jgi:FkbM family methyltransferase